MARFPAGHNLGQYQLGKSLTQSIASTAWKVKQKNVPWDASYGSNWRCNGDINNEYEKTGTDGSHGQCEGREIENSRAFVCIRGFN